MSEFSSRIKISAKMADVINQSQKHLYTWLEGSSQCGKSVTSAIAFARIIENAPREDNLFLCLGFTQASAINNVFECGGFGLIYYFANRCKMIKYKGPSGKLKTAIDCLQIKTKNGNKIVVPFGASTKTANNAWHGWRVAGFLFDEIDRCCQESIDEMRQRITSVKNAHIIITQNPNFEKHPIYTFLKELQDKNLVYYTHWTLDDNIGMSLEQIAKKKAEYDPNSPFYKRYVLGLRVNPESKIYTLYDYTILEDFNPKDYIEYITVCDQGQSISASVFILAGLKYNQETKQYNLDILKRYYYKNQGKSGASVKMFIDTARDYGNFIKECIDLMGYYPKMVYIDDDVEFYRNILNAFRELQLQTTNLRYVIKDSIEQRIKAGLNLIYMSKLHFYKDCKEIIEDFDNAVYDGDKIEKQGKFERLKAYNDLGHLDGIDAVEYAFTHYKNKLYIK